jgi:hypothetical protein
MKVPGIEDLLASSQKDIDKKNHELRLIEIARDSEADPAKKERLELEARIKRSQIRSEEQTMLACRSRVRQEKIDRLGI